VTIVSLLIDSNNIILLVKFSGMYETVVELRLEMTGMRTKGTSSENALLFPFPFFKIYYQPPQRFPSANHYNKESLILYGADDDDITTHITNFLLPPLTKYLMYTT
jgi:hypothetical protein